MAQAYRSYLVHGAQAAEALAAVLRRDGTDPRDVSWSVAEGCDEPFSELCAALGVTPTLRYPGYRGAIHTGPMLAGRANVWFASEADIPDGLTAMEPNQVAMLEPEPGTTVTAGAAEPMAGSTTPTLRWVVQRV
jgi:hypothetical protein